VSILGDLEQRGYRFRDLLSVLPALWYAHFRREWTGPIPNLAGASEEALLRRSAQLHDRIGSIPYGRIFLAFAVVSMVLSPGFNHLLQIFLATVFLRQRAAALPVIPIEIYRSALIARILPSSGGFLLLCAFGLPAESYPWSAGSAAALTVALWFYRWTRLYREYLALLRFAPISG
jgi:hypothetical protein